MRPHHAYLPRMRASYGPKSGPKAGSRASSPGEQAAACDYQKTRELGRARDCEKNFYLLESAAEALVPGLGGGDADEGVFAVARVEVEVGEELQFGQRVRGVDAQVLVWPG